MSKEMDIINIKDGVRIDFPNIGTVTVHIIGDKTIIESYSCITREKKLKILSTENTENTENKKISNIKGTENKFNQFIKDVFKEYENTCRIFKETVNVANKQVEIPHHNFFGIIYPNNNCFSDITNICNYLKNHNSNALFLSSKKQNQTLLIYDYEIKDYQIAADTLIIYTDTKKIEFDMN